MLLTELDLINKTEEIAWIYQSSTDYSPLYSGQAKGEIISSQRYGSVSGKTLTMTHRTS